MGKSTISMAMLNRFLYVYQAGYQISNPFHERKPAENQLPGGHSKACFSSHGFWKRGAESFFINMEMCPNMIKYIHKYPIYIYIYSIYIYIHKYLSVFLSIYLSIYGGREGEGMHA